MRVLLCLILLGVLVDGDKPVCPKDEPLIRCIRKPCEVPGVSCPRFPEATCENYYCGGCKTKWYVKKGNKGKRPVTHQCQEKDPK